ncbi:helix-turn-helix domain-containing protein [Brochothrix thermosphacta]|uniref:helix-turn-helix domain-containing protein n=1 Tax=Brochothrix thermosphacta TaxID=2756 RepID=UPI00083FB760|nr:LexA family transcriptional regulator [Brochothrix thermosphacta]ODJ54831.1 DNA-binding protein [Brochothrix thermosphacta]ODJ63274.1 DNA-binding protein [Brochothrix thermosphacta]ODJ66921.1 DNA-binding protein [Brochothrix thermosphacta]
MDNILKERRLEKKLTLEEVGEKVGVGKSTVRKWENGMIENMGRDKIVLLSKALDISPLEILGIEDELAPSSIETIYNQLNEQRQTKVYNYASKQLEEQNSNVTSIDKNKKVYILGKTAANPTEVSYGDAVYDETIDTNIPRNADCALVIQGDSMEPLLHDGSIVFYKQQCEVENGEIAIVDIDGNGVTCKKVYFNYDDNIVLLKSLNEKYDDRELSPERVRIIGKVVL